MFAPPLVVNGMNQILAFPSAISQLLDKSNCSMNYCSNLNCPARPSSGEPAAYDDSVETCPACGLPLTGSVRLESLRLTPLSKKVLVTLGVLVVYLGARHIPLPTVKPNLSLAAGTEASVGIMALGLSPLIIGYVLVELAALLVPAWRALRVGGPAGRAKLHRASLAVGMFVAFFQALVLAAWMDVMGVSQNPGLGFRLITVVTLLGATAVVVVMMRMVDREGLGSGFAVLLLAGLIPNVVGLFKYTGAALRAGSIDLSTPFGGVFFGAAVVGAALWTFSSYRILPSDPGHDTALIGRPACGLIPLATVPTVFAFLAKMRRSTPESSASLPATLVLSIAVAALLAFLFNRPDRVARAWKSLLPGMPGGIPRLKEVILESVLFVVLIVGLDIWAVRRFDYNYLLNPVTILLATGILCDLVREWLARQSQAGLSSVWEIHQSYAVAPTLLLLQGEGIPALAQGRRLHALLQFFGPYVPVQILVPAEHAPRAHALLQARWPVEGGAG
jgi:hypothetical protein